MKSKHSDQFNLLIAVILSTLILLYWQYYVENPRQQNDAIAQKIKEKAEHKLESETPQNTKTRPELIAESPRLPIQSDFLHGSLALKGLRLDDLTLAQYKETLAKNSPDVTLLSPGKLQSGYFVEIGFLSEDKTLKLPDENAVWKSNAKLITPNAPVVLNWDNEAGVIFEVKLSLDSKYMFDIVASARDANGTPVKTINYAFINRIYDIKNSPTAGIMHEGPIGVFDGILKEAPYKTVHEQKDIAFEPTSGWLAIADKYWLAALIPQDNSFSAHLSYYESANRDHYQVEYISKSNETNHLLLFAGAKELDLLDSYAAKFNIRLFDHAVDLGFFDFLTKPIFKLLTAFYAMTGNFGVAILLLTVVVKLCMYPLASKSFRSMSQMKVLQPKMAELRERHKDDKLKLNQEMIDLYKKEKVNPASGCLPIFIQIPVFFALYKVLYVTIEMRHAPFFGWIKDLSVPDPTNIFNLFGLVNWQPPALLHLGVFPILMCLTMVIQQRQSPPPPDPTQAQVMKLMPFIFLFISSSFAAGLVIYWCWSNTLTILQQWYIKRRHG